jgi:hypothetical protein
MARLIMFAVGGGKSAVALDISGSETMVLINCIEEEETRKISRLDAMSRSVKVIGETAV